MSEHGKSAYDRQAQDHRTAQQHAFEWACKAQAAAEDPNAQFGATGRAQAFAQMWANVASVLEPQPEPITAELHTAELAPCRVVLDLTGADNAMRKMVRRIVRMNGDDGPDHAPDLG